MVAEDVKVDSAGGVDVRVVDLGYECHFGRSKGIIDWDDNVLKYRVMRDALVHMGKDQWNLLLRNDHPHMDCLVGLERSHEDGTASRR